MTKPLNEFTRFCKANDYDRHSFLDLADLKKAWMDGQAAGYNQALEDAATLAEAPFVGQPHSERSIGKAEAANTIAQAIRGLLPEKAVKTRRLK